jgi:hypothetical protein
MPYADPDVRREYNRRYNVRNKDAIAEQQRDYRSRNKEAVRERQRRYAVHNKEALARQSWLRSIWRRHGLRPEGIIAMHDAQRGLCYLCSEPVSLDEAVIEHGHQHCGAYFSCPVCRRGIAHQGCNTAIGLAGDDPDKLRQMADALEAAKRGVAARMAAAAEQLTLELEA